MRDIGEAFEVSPTAFTRADRYDARELAKVFSYKMDRAGFIESHKRYLRAQGFKKRRSYPMSEWSSKEIDTYKKMMRGAWDGRVEFSSGGHYPSGLLYLYNYLHGHQTKFPKLEFDDFVKEPRELPFTPYDFQDRALQYIDFEEGATSPSDGELLEKHRPTPVRVKKLLETVVRYNQPCPICLLWLATAAGKTEIIASAIHKYQKRCVITAFDRTTVYNLYERLQKYFPRNNIYLHHGSNLKRRAPKNADVVISTLDTIEKKHCELGNRIWFSDECHRKIELQKKIADKYGFVGRIGLTATLPTTIDGRAYMVGLFGPVRAKISEGELQKKGVVGERRIYFVKSPEPTILMDSYDGATKASGYERNICRNTGRNNLACDIVESVMRYNKTALVFCRKKDHARRVHEMMEKRGIKSSCVTGDVKDLKSQYKLLKDGKLNVIVGTSITTTGLNIPSLFCTIALSGEFADTRRTQERGRSARKYEESLKLHFDFQDNWKKGEIPNWSATHAKRRIKSAKDQGNMVKRISEKEIDKVIDEAINASSKSRSKTYTKDELIELIRSTFIVVRR